MNVDQCLPDFALHDAIGSHVLQVRAALRGAGYESEIWGERIDERLAGEARPYQDYPEGRRGALIYQLSTDSGMLPWLVERKAAGTAIAVNYHNITPSEYFRRWEPAIADRLDLARQQMAEVANIAETAMAVSSFNEKELLEAGFRRTVVTPLLVDLGALGEAGSPDGRLLGGRSRGTKWLFVGRLAPNKCQHDVVAAFAIYRKLYDAEATLTLIGGPSSYRYQRAVERLASDIGVSDAVDHRAGMGTRQLAEQYEAADVFVCMSEHEGFCVPIVEAMFLGLPVVAYDAAAISETLADGGLLLDSKDPLDVAVAVHQLLQDAAARSKAVEAGKARAQEFTLESTTFRFLQAVDAWLKGLR